MSGGAYGYLYGRIEDLASQIEDRMDPRLQREHPDPMVYCHAQRTWIKGPEAQAIIAAAQGERAWFVALLRRVGKAARDIEWVDSGDYGPGDEVAAIRAIRAVVEREEPIDPDVVCLDFECTECPPTLGIFSVLASREEQRALSPDHIPFACPRGHAQTWTSYRSHSPVDRAGYPVVRR